jgi:glycosyltransferase involved in cell wall biosynthesis
VLASNLGALPEIVVDSETGFLRPPGDIDAWIESADRMSEDRVSERMGAAAHRRWSEVHDPARGLSTLESVYREAIRGRREARRPR